MREWSACDEDEDVVTMALTAVRRLVERCGVRWEDIGMLQVGSVVHVLLQLLHCASAYSMHFASPALALHTSSVRMHRTYAHATHTHRWAPSRCSTGASRSRAT